MSTSGGSSGGGGGPPYQTGSGAPTVVPASIGQLYIDTTNGTLFIASGVLAADWVMAGGNDASSSNIGTSAGGANVGGPYAEMKDGSGDNVTIGGGEIAMGIAGGSQVAVTASSVALGVPLSTAAVATVTSPSVSTGVAFTPGATGDCFLSWYVSHAGTLTVTMGPSTGAEHTIYSAVAVLADGAFDIWVPAAWKVVITLAASATISNVTATLV